MNILFVCTGNTCRSPMAERIMRKLAEENGLDVDVKSAGILTIDGLDASLNSIKALEEKNIGLEGFESTMINEELVDNSDLILTMTEVHRDSILMEYGYDNKDKIFTLSEYIGQTGDVMDPYGGSLDLYRNVAEELESKLLNLAKILTNK